MTKALLVELYCFKWENPLAFYRFRFHISLRLRLRCISRW